MVTKANQGTRGAEAETASWVTKVSRATRAAEASGTSAESRSVSTEATQSVGAQSGSRTHDLRITSALLCRLSYLGGGAEA